MISRVKFWFSSITQTEKWAAVSFRMPVPIKHALHVNLSIYILYISSAVKGWFDLKARQGRGDIVSGQLELKIRYS